MKKIIEELWLQYMDSDVADYMRDRFEFACEELLKAQREACAKIFLNTTFESETDKLRAILNAEVE